MGQHRTLEPYEKALIDQLLSFDFPGREQLLKQASSLRARVAASDDDYGTLELVTESPERANVIERVPVEAEAYDEDGVPIAILLHVVNGFMDELEIFKYDGTPIRKHPDPAKLKVIVRGTKP
jgi:hypothetical protein